MLGDGPKFNPYMQLEISAESYQDLPLKGSDLYTKKSFWCAADKLSEVLVPNEQRAFSLKGLSLETNELFPVRCQL